MTRKEGIPSGCHKVGNTWTFKQSPGRSLRDVVGCLRSCGVGFVILYFVVRNLGENNGEQLSFFLQSPVSAQTAGTRSTNDLQTACGTVALVASSIELMLGLEVC